MPGLLAAAVAASLNLAAPAPTHGSEVSLNPNRITAGRLEGHVLTVALVATRGVWYPEGKNAAGLEIQAFAVEGGDPTVPGPLLRVPAGTELRVSVRSELLLPLTVHGLGTQSFVVPAGETRRATFTPAPGTSFYWATDTGAALARRSAGDSQLNGVIVADPPGAPTDDRIFVLTHHYDNQFEVWAINGASWPFTERLAYAVGDAVRWRWINASDEEHPLHLHGHYFRVDEGDRLFSTDLLASGDVKTVSWIPERAGNWLFHCHVLFHISAKHHLTDPMPDHDMNDPQQHMAGLVLGIAVAPKLDAAAPSVSAPSVAAPARQLHLVVGERAGLRFANFPALGYALVESGATPPPVTSPGPLIVLNRGQPVEIAVENRLATATAVHWHGIELESYFDGVPGWTGSAGHLSPPIEPSATFTARFTPPRAGTFIYHTHLDDYRQLSSGLYGPLIVADPEHPYDPVTDKILVYGSNGDVDGDHLVVNGSPHPAPLELQAGVTYRLRFIGIIPADAVTIALTRDGAPAIWHAIAKDGADLPAADQTDLAALLNLQPGETYDFALRVDSPGNLTVAAFVLGTFHADLELHVR